MSVAPLVLLALWTTGSTPTPLPALSPAPAQQRVPFFENFSRLEVGAAIAVAGAGTFLLSGGHLLFDAPSPRLSAPAPDSLDGRISRALHREGSGRMLWSGPDLVGLALPVLPLLYYGADSWALFRSGQTVFAHGDSNPHHRLMTYVEAIGLTYLVTGMVKYSVGRPRPYTQAGNDHPELRRRRSEDNLSFFSGHAASTFAVGAFLAEDLSRTLRWRAQPGASRVLLGTVLPYGLGYGVPAFIALSRVVDQQHWPSDVAVGALAGTLIAQVTYALHFDAAGNPRRRHPGGAGVAVVPLPPTAAGGAGMALSVTGRF